MGREKYVWRLKDHSSQGMGREMRKPRDLKQDAGYMTTPTNHASPFKVFQPNSRREPAFEILHQKKGGYGQV